MTPLDLISLAMKTAGAIGAGQTPSSEDTNDVFTILNFMLGQWNRQRWLIYHLVDTACVSTGALTYTVGPAQQFNIPRPDRIKSAFVRLPAAGSSSPIDFGLNIIQSREDYNAIAIKNLTALPSNIFLDSNYPNGTIYVWPVPPESQYEIHISTKDPLTAFPSLTTEIALPPEYFDCLLWNLTVRIAPLYQLPVNPATVVLARTALNVIRGANAQIPSLSIPGILLPRRSGIDPTLGSFNGLPWSF